MYLELSDEGEHEFSQSSNRKEIAQSDYQGFQGNFCTARVFYKLFLFHLLQFSFKPIKPLEKSGFQFFVLLFFSTLRPVILGEFFGVFLK